MKGFYILLKNYVDKAVKNQVQMDWNRILFIFTLELIYKLQEKKTSTLSGGKSNIL